MLGMLDDEKYENNNTVEIGTERAGFLVGLAGVLFHFFCTIFSNRLVGISMVWIYAEINNKHPSKTHACCKTRTIYDASGSQLQ